MRMKGGEPLSESRPFVAAVFNTSPDTVEMLRVVLTQAGFVVVSGYTFELRDLKVDLDAFMRQHQPNEILYDLAPPYEENCRLFEHLRATPAFKGGPSSSPARTPRRSTTSCSLTSRSMRSSANRTT